MPERDMYHDDKPYAAACRRTQVFAEALRKSTPVCTLMGPREELLATIPRRRNA
jgi:hypothetical protein